MNRILSTTLQHDKPWYKSSKVDIDLNQLPKSENIDLDNPTF